MDPEALIRDYIARLDQASRLVPAARRAELHAEVAEHIETALAEAGLRDEVSVRNVLERLGAPEDIVAAEIDPSPAPGQVPYPFGALEIVTLAVLAIGGVIVPVIGSLPGLAFLWLSAHWTTREKAIASLIVTAMVVLPFVAIYAIRLD